MGFDLNDEELKATREMNGASRDEIEVGEWVRTKRGEICKVLGVRQEQRAGKRVYSHLAYYLDNHKGSLTPAFIVKHSKNIIDLIEVGDYVNGKYVHFVGVNFIEYGNGKTINKEYIKSIVTKEQFNSIAYRLEE